MYKKQIKFFGFSIIVILISLGISLFYQFHQEQQLEKKVTTFTDSLTAKEIKKEKNFFTKVKDSIFGSEEKKIEKKLNKKLEESIKIQDEYLKEQNKDNKEKLTEEFRNISNEIAKLQSEYYSLTGTYYDQNYSEKDSNKELTKDKVEVPEEQEILTPKEKFKKNLKNYYIKQNYSLKNTSIFEKVKNFLTSNDIEIFEDANRQVKILYEENKVKVKELSEGVILKEIEYRTDDNYATITVETYDRESGAIRILEDINEGYGWDEFKDGSKIEFRHENQIPVGSAVKYYTNGDREEFIYHNGKKHGFSTYYFANGDKEEVYYVENKLEGKAKYTYADGYVEIYRYKNGRREE